ncbi:hypothetical protein HQQ80_07800 [Microbacteriaceae bacterium VKM Ac-2855]|nr:hypothetical protein [Microbacteriaceae bacterium VKM Ac-2855]
MHEITIAQSRYLTQDAVAAAILAVADSVAGGSGPVTIEFPIVPRSTPEDWDAITYIRVAITAASRVHAQPSSALEFKPDAGQTVRISADPLYTPVPAHAPIPAHAPVPANAPVPDSIDELEYLGYEAL